MSKNTCMQKIVLKIFTIVVLLCEVVSLQAQSGSVEWISPTCPDPSNGGAKVHINDAASVESGEFDVQVLIAESGAYKTNSYKIPVVVGQASYEYEIPLNLPFGKEIIVIVKAPGETSSFIIETNPGFNKPEYSASLTKLREAGCDGQPVGEAEISINAGVGPYTWQWFSTTDPSFPTYDNIDKVTTLTPGSYYVKVLDSKDCPINSEPLEIKTQDIQISVTKVTHVTCKDTTDGEIAVSVSGAYGKYSLHWVGDKTDIWDYDVTGDAHTTSSLAADIYHVYVEDEIGCKDDTGPEEVTEPDKKITLSLESSADLKCKDVATGEAKFSVENAVGNVTYEWSDGASTSSSRNDLAADIPYVLVATDANGCKAQSSVTLSQPATKVQVEITNHTEPSCFGSSDGEIKANASGGNSGVFSYTWNKVSGTETNSNIPAGDYTVVATDENGCKDSTDFTLDQPKPMDVTVNVQGGSSSDPKSVLCNGDKVTIEVSVDGGVLPMSYKWDGDTDFGTTTKVTVGAGDTKVIVKDGNGCEQPVTTTITEPELLSVTIVEDTKIACNGGEGELRASVSGGTEPYSYNWTTGSTDVMSGTLVKGKYSVAIEDANGCKAAQDYDIGEPEYMSAKIMISPETCKNVSTGNIYVQTDGGTAPFSYKWNTGATTSSIGGLTNTKYSVSVVDANGCSYDDNIDLKNVNKFSISWTSKSVKCEGQANGSAKVIMKNGYHPFIVKWSTGEENQTSESNYQIENLTEGTYSVEVTDDRGCVLKTDATVKTITPIEIKTLTLTPSACTIPTGTATATIKNGTLPYTYAWSNGVAVKKNTEMAPGDYTLKVTDANGCEVDSTITILKKATLTVDVISPNTEITCEGGETGEVSAIASKGVEPYSYSWSNGGTTETISNLGKGTYTVVATDAEGCEATQSITFVEDNILTVTEKEVSDVTCFGGSDGYIVVDVTGGKSPYSISWNNGETSFTNKDLVAGDYTVTVTDAKGCTVTKTITVGESSEVKVSIENLTSVQCVGVCDVTADANVSGGVAPYTYLWSSSETTSSATTLCEGEQNVVVTDANGCATKKIFTVAGRTEQLAISSSNIQKPICGEATPTGKITIVATGSISGDYFYSWKKDGIEISTTNEIANVPAGSYDLQITDGTCEYNTSLALSNELTATADFNYILSNCEGESYEVVISNEATADYTYLWSNGQTTKVATGLKNGTYTLVATDKDDCVLSTSIDVVEKPITLSVDVVDVNCFGKANGSAEVTATNTVGDVTYSWKDASGSVVGSNKKLENVVKGIYTATVFDANHTSCPATIEATINEPNKIQVFLSEIEPSYCKLGNGSATVKIVGGQSPFTYSWKDNGGAVVGTSEIVDNIYSDTEYSVVVVDAVGCEMSGTISISDVSNFSLTSIVPNKITCADRTDGELEVYTVNGFAPFSYKWSHNTSLNNKKVTGLGKGLYSVSVSDSKGCVAHLSDIALEDPELVVATIEESPGIQCHGKTGDLVAAVVGGTGPYTYKWMSNTDAVINSGSDPELTAQFAGVYKLQVIDVYDCPSTIVTHEMLDPSELKASFTVKVTECGDSAKVGSITLDEISGGVENAQYRFRWGSLEEEGTWTDYELEENRTLSNLAAGEFICTITNSTTPGSCYITENLYTYPSLPDSIVVDIEHTRCGFYTDESKNEGSIEVKELYIAEGDYDPLSRTLVDKADYSFAWSDVNVQTNTKASNLAVGSYEVTITGKNGCSQKFNAGSVDAYVNLDISIETTDDGEKGRTEICFGDSVQLSIVTKTTLLHGYTPENSAETYEWLSKENNCEASLLTPYEKSTWVHPLTKYYSDSTEIQASYFVDGCQSAPAKFFVSHFDSVNFAIEVYDTLGVYLGNDSVFGIKNERYLFNPIDEPWYTDKVGDNGVSSIFWRSFDVEKKGKGAISDTTTNEKTYARSGIYGLLTRVDESNYVEAIATTTHGCYEHSMVFINVVASSVIPSGFTPNGDGINDTWVIPYLQACPNAHVTVFNRWGSKVFETKKDYYEHPWNGKSKTGGELPMGTYYYVIEYNDSNETPTQTGSVSILR